MLNISRAGSVTLCVPHGPKISRGSFWIHSCPSLLCSLPGRLASGCLVAQPAGVGYRRWTGREGLGMSSHRPAVVTVGQPAPAPVTLLPPPLSLQLPLAPPQVRAHPCFRPSFQNPSLTSIQFALRAFVSCGHPNPCKCDSSPRGRSVAVGLVHVRTLPCSACLRRRPHRA